LSSRDFNELYEECFKVRDDFLDTVNKYREKRGQTPISATTNEDWIGVEKSVNAACNALDTMKTEDEELRGFSGRVRKAFHGLCKNIGIANFLINFIPTDFMFSSVLCSGLKVVFSAMEQAGHHRTLVHETLEELPDILNDSADYMTTLGADEGFHRKMASLYVSTLRLLRAILKWFIANPICK
jgi:hypothetical protein